MAGNFRVAAGRSAAAVYENDVYRFDVEGNSWSTKNVCVCDVYGMGSDIDWGAGTVRGYLLGGDDGSRMNDNQALTPNPDVWSAKTVYPQVVHYIGAGGSGVYIIGYGGNDGVDIVNTNRFAYSANTWTSRTALAVAVGGHQGSSFGEPTGDYVWGFFGTGVGLSRRHSNSDNTWSNKTASGNITGDTAISFYSDEGGKSYHNEGGTTTYEEYDHVGDSWTAKTSPTTDVSGGVGNGVGELGEGYLTGGYTSYPTALNNNQAYDISGNSWTAKTVLPAVRMQGGSLPSGVTSYVTKIQWQDGASWRDVVSSDGDVGAGQLVGSSKEAYWTSTHTDKDDYSGTIGVRIVAEEEE